jgi:hypothetical protein
MSAPYDSADNGDGGMLRGHGIAVALLAIFLGMAMVVAFAASDGAIFGLNSNSPAGDNTPVIDSDAGGAEVLPKDEFDEDSGRESAPQSGADTNAVSAPEQSTTLSPEERRLLAMRNFSWDSIAVQYIASSQDITDKFDQQNFTRQKPAQPGAEPLFLSDRISADVDRDREDRVIDIDTPIDTPAADEEEQPEEEEEQDEEPRDEEDQQEEEDNSDGGSGSDDDQSGDSGSGSNSTNTNSTSTEDSGSDGESDTSGDDSGIGASISIG